MLQWVCANIWERDAVALHPDLFYESYFPGSSTPEGPLSKGECPNTIIQCQGHQTGNQDHEPISPLAAKSNRENLEVNVSRAALSSMYEAFEKAHTLSSNQKG